MTELRQIHVDVLGWVSMGKSAHEIATIIGMPERQVRSRQVEILKHFDACNLYAALGSAFRRGVIV